MRVAIGIAALCMSLVLSLAPTAQASPPIRLAVIDFQPSGAVGEYETLGAGLQSMLTTDLSAVATITVVERAQLAALQRELKLSRSALADPKTALRIGKLAGASHLLAGSFTLVGNKMRLDARVIDVATAKVHFAAKIEGDKDAFFELEKNLAAQVIESVGVHPSAKERSVLGRVHTADLVAFQKFSQGLVLFDDAHYDRAFEALKDAAKRDEEFKLARSTLQQYERVAAELRAKAQLLEAQAAATGALARKEELSAAQAVQQRLLAIADRSSAPQHERAAALYLLASMSDVSDDKFANERLRELFITRYMLEFSPLFPKFAITPVEPFGERFNQPEVPTDPTQVSAAVAEAAAAITFQQPGLSAEHIQDMRKESVSSNFRSEFGQLIELLPLDFKGRANALQRLYDLGAKFVPGSWQAEALAKVALRRRDSLELRESTRLLREAAILSSDPHQVRGYAREVEKNAQIAQALQRVSSNKCLREQLITDITRGGTDNLDATHDPKVDPCASNDLMRARMMHVESPLLVGDTRAWLLSRELPSVVWSGPRTDGYRTDELRYLSSASSAEGDPLGAWSIVMLEGIPRALAEIRFNLSYDLTEDVPKAEAMERYKGPKLNGERPNVSVIFGARNVLATGRDRQAIPMRASGITIGAGRVALADVETVLTSNVSRAETLRITSKKSTPIELARKGSIEVRVTREPSRLTVEVAGQQIQFDSSAAAHGFIGIVFEGRGYVRVLQPKISAPK